MAKKLKPITEKFNKIKSIYKAGTNGRTKYGENFPIDGELDILCQEFLVDLAKLTKEGGYNQIVEGVELDAWKDRIWNLYENAGLLEGMDDNGKVVVNSKFFREDDKNIDEPINWFKTEESGSFEINEEEFEFESIEGLDI
jgi:hypothetical protein